MYCCYASRDDWIPLTFIFEDQLHESDFSSVALDLKHFTSISVLKDPLYFVRVKSFQNTVW